MNGIVLHKDVAAVVEEIEDEVVVAPKKQKQKKDPNAPKKPLTSFMIYLKKRRLELAGSDLMKQGVHIFTAEMGKEWGQLGVDEKAMYKHDGKMGVQILA